MSWEEESKGLLIHWMQASKEREKSRTISSFSIEYLGWIVVPLTKVLKRQEINKSVLDVVSLKCLLDFHMDLRSSSWGYKLRTSRRLGLRRKLVSQQHADNKITQKNTIETEKESSPRINPDKHHHDWLKGRKIVRLKGQVRKRKNR